MMATDIFVMGNPYVDSGYKVTFPGWRISDPIESNVLERVVWLEKFSRASSHAACSSSCRTGIAVTAGIST